ARPLAGPPLLLLLACVALGWNLNGYRLLDPDEGRNAEVAREMAQSNDYLVPHLDGLPYLDKPIVYFAAAAAIMELTGVSEPVAVALPLLVLVPHALATGASVRRLFPRRGLVAFAAIALPWFVAVSLAHPDFPGYVFLRETLARVTTTRFHRTAPFWYYLPIVPVAAFPWIIPALARLRHWRLTWAARRDPSAREPLLFACWVIVPLLFFTLNQSKLPQYVLPLIPAFTLAATRNLVTGASTTGARAYAALALLAGVALVALTV